MAKKKQDLTAATQATGSTSAAGNMLSANIDPNDDLKQGNIRPTGVGLREGEIAAIDAIGQELGAMLESTPIARNALIRIAVRRMIFDIRGGKISYDDLAAYFKIPEKPKPKLVE